jgi:uncharacterized membrane protein YheB (UPF0754 family)
MEELRKLCLTHNHTKLFNRLSEEEIKALGSKTKKKTNATKKATKIRQNTAKEKIMNAVNMMRLFNKKITVYAVAKEANVSYNTASKYKDFILQNGH